MTRRLTNAITLLGLCLLLSTDAFAQLKDNIELNLFGAGSIYNKKSYEIAYPQAVNPIPGQLKLDAHARYGVRLGVYTRGHWGEEFFYSYEPNSLRLSKGGPVPSKIELPIRVHNYGVNALYYLQETEAHVILPFVSAGIGGTAYQLKEEARQFVQDPARGNMPDMDNSNELAFNFGFGFKTRSTGWLGIRADARDYVGRSPSFGLTRQSTDPAATVLPATGAIHNGEISVGLVFYFGKR